MRNPAAAPRWWRRGAASPGRGYRRDRPPARQRAADPGGEVPAEPPDRRRQAVDRRRQAGGPTRDRPAGPQREDGGGRRRVVPRVRHRVVGHPRPRRSAAGVGAPGRGGGAGPARGRSPRRPARLGRLAQLPDQRGTGHRRAVRGRTPAIPPKRGRRSTRARQCPGPRPGGARSCSWRSSPASSASSSGRWRGRPEVPAAGGRAPEELRDLRVARKGDDRLVVGTSGGHKLALPRPPQPPRRRPGPLGQVLRAHDPGHRRSGRARSSWRRPRGTSSTRRSAGAAARARSTSTTRRPSRPTTAPDGRCWPSAPLGRAPSAPRPTSRSPPGAPASRTARSAAIGDGQGDLWRSSMAMALAPYLLAAVSSGQTVSGASRVDRAGGARRGAQHPAGRRPHGRPHARVDVHA